MHDTLPETAAGLSTEDQRQAYNAAFEEFGLSWHWDDATHARFGGRDGLRAYLQAEQSHLLRAYEADFLVDAIEAARERCLACMADSRQRRTAPSRAPQTLRA